MSAQDGFDIFLSQLRPTPAPASVIAQAQAAAQAIQAAQAAKVTRAMDPMQAMNAAMVAHELANQPPWLTALQNPTQPLAHLTNPMLQHQSPLHFVGQMVEHGQVLPGAITIGMLPLSPRPPMLASVAIEGPPRPPEEYSDPCKEFRQTWSWDTSRPPIENFKKALATAFAMRDLMVALGVPTAGAFGPELLYHLILSLFANDLFCWWWWTISGEGSQQNAPLLGVSGPFWEALRRAVRLEVIKSHAELAAFEKAMKDMLDALSSHDPKWPPQS